MIRLPVQRIRATGSRRDGTWSLRSPAFGAALGFHKDVTLAIYSSRRGRNAERDARPRPSRQAFTNLEITPRQGEYRTNLPVKAARRGKSAKLALHLRPLER
jgi:hypothetical protein